MGERRDLDHRTSDLARAEVREFVPSLKTGMVLFLIAPVVLPFDLCTPICAMPTEYQNEESSGSGASSKAEENVRTITWHLFPICLTADLMARFMGKPRGLGFWREPLDFGSHG